MRLRFWSRVLKIGSALGWTRLLRHAHRRRFRAELALQKLDVAKLKVTSDDRDASKEEGIVAKPKKRRVPKPPRSASA